LVRSGGAFACLRRTTVSSPDNNQRWENAMGLAREFREFAMKGNVIDMAVGVIIGAAFGKIVTSLVEDVIMPPLGKVIGGVNFTDLAVNLGMDPAGKEVLWRYGNFLQITFQFLIVAMVLFMVIRTLNKLKKPDPAVAPASPPRQEMLLEEIRDLLAKR
jgi:large conductance mechanosensitive channel